MNFEFFSKQRTYEKIQWIKVKSVWCVVSLLLTATVFLATLFITLAIFFYLRPPPYQATLAPEFQVKRGNGFKLFAVFENLALKADLCNQEGYVYSGSSMSQNQFCDFKYQTIPRLSSHFDVSMLGLSSLQVKYASVCILKLPKRQTFHYVNSTEQLQRPPPNYRYVCQKYRVYKNIHIGNNLDGQSLVFFEIEIQLTDKGFQEFEGSDAAIKLEEDTTSLWRFINDYYWLLGTITSIVVAIWVSFMTFVLCMTYMLWEILRQKQIEEERMLQRVRKQE